MYWRLLTLLREYISRAAATEARHHVGSSYSYFIIGNKTSHLPAATLALCLVSDLMGGSRFAVHFNATCLTVYGTSGATSLQYDLAAQ